MHDPSEIADGQEAREDVMVGLACCNSRVERGIILCYEGNNSHGHGHGSSHYWRCMAWRELGQRKIWREHVEERYGGNCQNPSSRHIFRPAKSSFAPKIKIFSSRQNLVLEILKLIYCSAMTKTRSAEMQRGGFAI